MTRAVGLGSLTRAHGEPLRHPLGAPRIMDRPARGHTNRGGRQLHSLRCEHSTSDPKRCRCTGCGGARHGVQAGETGTYADEQAPGVLAHDPIPQESNLGIHHWFEAWVSA